MNRRVAWIWGLITAGIATVVGLIAYNAGLAAHVATTSGDGRVIYPGYGFGFPFFGFFWFLLIIFLVSRFFWWRPWGYGRGYWHRHDHDTTPTPPSDPGKGA